MVVWGTTFVSSKVLLDHGLMPDEIFFLRFLQAYLALIPLCHRRWLAKSWRDELIFLGLGIFGGSAYFLAENTALQFSTTSNVSILVGSTPLVTALLLGAIYKADRLSLKQSLGSVVAFVGMALVVINGQLVLQLNPLGDSLALAASLTWAIYSLFMRWISGNYSTLFITRKVFFYGLVTIVPFMLLSGHTPQWAHISQPVVLYNLLYLGLIASSLCYLLWNYVLKVIGTIKATNYIYMQSFITMLAAKLVLGERITLMAILGVVLLISGLVILQKNKHKA